MKNNSTKGKMSIIWFIPSMVKKTGHIYQKRSQGQELRSLKYLWYHKNILIILSKKNPVMLFKVSLETITLLRRALKYSKPFIFLS